jgi:bifunctional UDP-N-acetylglucosamine pyrophosphorylase/glucosamine-1-phosphate N-acetyltransferase
MDGWLSMQINLCAVVLAAGLGKRMNSSLPKVLHKICGKTLIDHVIMNLAESNITDVAVVTGHGAEQVEEAVKREHQYVVFCRQMVQMGTAHAVSSAADFLKSKSGYALVLCGDAPLISAQIIGDLVQTATEKDLDLCILSAVLPEGPGAYGRIVRTDGAVSGIVESRDASSEILKINEVNSGAYLFKISKLLEILPKIDNNNSQKEYYLTDAVKLFISKNYKVDAYACPNPKAVLAANDRYELSQCEEALRETINIEHMIRGVTLIDPHHTYIARGASIGPDTIIYPGTVIEEACIIGSGNVIYTSRISNSIIGSNNVIDNAVIEDSEVSDNVTIGPYAHLRPKAVIGDGVRIGNFVEIKNSRIAKHTKAAHLTYIGDSDIGARVNFGCGVVTANYDGVRKHKTEIGDDAFIGCNVNLIAPIKIGKKALIGAGSTITRDVEDYALAVERSKTFIRKNYNSLPAQSSSTGQNQNEL